MPKRNNKAGGTYSILDIGFWISDFINEQRIEYRSQRTDA
jgi:hypothetical protein